VRISPDRLLVGAEVAAVLVTVVLLATVGYFVLWPLLDGLPTVASFIALAAPLGLLVRLTLEIPDGIHRFRTWHTRKAAELLDAATRRRWATTTDLATTDRHHWTLVPNQPDNGHDPYS
jgi:hypothetical protein